MPVLSPSATPLLMAALLLGGCGEISRQPETAGTGPDPHLPEPRTALIPTVQVAPVQRWTEGSAPRPRRAWW